MYDNLPMKNKHAARADRSNPTGNPSGPGDPPKKTGSKFDLMKSTMDRKLSEVDQKIGGTHAGDAKKRSIRGKFEAAMKNADPDAWESYEAKKVDPSTTYETENVHGEVVSRQGREGTQDRKKVVKYISK